VVVMTLLACCQKSVMCRSSFERLARQGEVLP
jgi:hypothetical protein